MAMLLEEQNVSFGLELANPAQIPQMGAPW
jgi:hypothetical protein